jgi:hypothetical protein
MPDRDAIHYHLVYGTRNFKGLEEFKKTEAVAIPFMHECRATAQRRRDEANGQGFLLPPDETYQERRFRSFNERRRQNARSDVVQLLNREKKVPYQTLFEEAMQYSTVIEKDLRQWLEEWRVCGLTHWSKSSTASLEMRSSTEYRIRKPRFNLRLLRDAVGYRGRIIRANPDSDCINHLRSRVRQLGADVKNTLNDETLISGSIVHVFDSP